MSEGLWRGKLRKERSGHEGEKSGGCASFFPKKERSHERYTQSTDEARFLKDEGENKNKNNLRWKPQGEGDAGSF